MAISLETAKTISDVTFLFAAEAAFITSGWLFSTQSAASGREFCCCLEEMLDCAILSGVGVLLFLLDPVPVDDEDELRFLVVPTKLNIHYFKRVDSFTFWQIHRIFSNYLI